MPYLSAARKRDAARNTSTASPTRQKRRKLSSASAWASGSNHLPSQLSGGEQQRVALARALINHPKLILADEPTGNLDEANEQIVLDLLQELHRAGHTILLVTHSPEIGRMADRRIELAHGRLMHIVAN